MSLIGQVYALCIASGKSGITAADAIEAAPGLKRKTAENCLTKLLQRGIAHAAGRRGHQRYFIDKAHAIEHHETHSAAAINMRKRAEELEQRAQAKALKAATRTTPPTSGPPRQWTAVQFAILERDYAKFGAKHVAEQIGISMRLVYKVAARRGIKYSPEPGPQSIPTPRPQPKRPRTVLAPPKSPRNSPDGTPAMRIRSVQGPAFLPGEPRIDASTKFTYGKPLQDPPRTNTFTHWG